MIHASAEAAKSTKTAMVQWHKSSYMRAGWDDAGLRFWAYFGAGFKWPADAEKPRK
jgi:hypothetical protein